MTIEGKKREKKLEMKIYVLIVASITWFIGVVFISIFRAQVVVFINAFVAALCGDNGTLIYMICGDSATCYSALLYLECGVNAMLLCLIVLMLRCYLIENFFLSTKKN